VTPKQTSVFMTPSSTKSALYSPRVLSPPSLCLLSPPATPKTSLERSPSRPAYKDIVSELYLGGQHLFAERIFSLLNPADLCSSLQVCTTWNHQVSCGAQFMNKISIYRRQYKEDAENLHKTEEPMETMVSPNKRKPLTDFTPNTQSQFRTAKPAFPASFTGSIKEFTNWINFNPSLQLFPATICTLYLYCGTSCLPPDVASCTHNSIFLFSDQLFH